MRISIQVLDIPYHLDDLPNLVVDENRKWTLNVLTSRSPSPRAWRPFLITMEARLLFMDSKTNFFPILQRKMLQVGLRIVCGVLLKKWKRWSRKVALPKMTKLAQWFHNINLHWGVLASYLCPQPTLIGVMRNESRAAVIYSNAQTWPWQKRSYFLHHFIQIIISRTFFANYDSRLIHLFTLSNRNWLPSEISSPIMFVVVQNKIFR